MDAAWADRDPNNPPVRPTHPVAYSDRGRMFSLMSARAYRLIGPDGSPYFSTTKGALGGHRGTKIYGRLDCESALRAIARGGPYPRYRVFFADEATAASAGYRPCAICMRPEYDAWKKRERR